MIALVAAFVVAAAQTPAKPPAAPPKPAGAPATPAPVAPATAVKPAAPGTPPAAPATPPQTMKTPVEAYTYEPENRRDPFISLIGTGAETAVTRKGEGISGMAIAEISVRGIMQSRGAYVAMVEGADKKTYVVHAGDKFADGTVKTILPTGLVIIQEVNDPLSLVKQREVRKLLRSLEDAK